MNVDSKDGLGIVLGKIVKVYRFIFDISVVEFANRNNISVNTIIKLEQENIDIVPLQLFGSLATSMDMPMEYLITICKEIKNLSSNSSMTNLLVCNRLSSYYLKRKSKEND